MDKLQIAQGVADKLFATENSIDQSIADASRLMGELMEARRAMGVSAITGDATVSKVAAALTALAEARKSVVEAHGELAEVQLRVGIRTKLVGIEMKPTASGEVAPRRLRQVV
jgi:hypothetical protein